MPFRKLRWKLITSSGEFSNGALSDVVKEAGDSILRFEVWRGFKPVLIADFSQGVMHSPVGTFGFDPKNDRPRFFKRRQRLISTGRGGVRMHRIKTTVCYGVGDRLFCEGGGFVVWKELAR